MRHRHPQNPNLKLIYDHDYQGLPLQPGYGPYIENYLERILSTIKHSLNKHRRVTAIRFDLRIPTGYPDVESRVISRFFDSLKSKLSQHQLRRGREGKRVYSPDVLYVWIRETASSHHQHYHCCIFVSGDAYGHLGSFKNLSSDSKGLNMAARIYSAWASALHCTWEEAQGLVHFPKDGVYSLNINSEQLIWQIGALFERLSYFAKVGTKHYGSGFNSFGCSRI